jgi:hypothetical protein
VAISARGLLSAYVAWGALDEVTVSAGATAPIGWAEDFDSNVTLVGKGGIPIAPGLNAGAGVEAYLAGEGTLVSAFAIVTVGSPDRYLSFAVHTPPAGAERLGAFGDRVVSAAGLWRQGRRLALLGEAWIGASEDGVDVLGAVGTRWFWRRVALDVGLASAPSQPFLPFASLAWTVTAP